MSSETRSAGFWSDGPERLEAGLREAEAEELASLWAKLRAAKDPARRTELLDEIGQVKSRYRKRRRTMLHSLFSTPGADD